jgi:predicted Zn-dependent peptidase
MSAAQVIGSGPQVLVETSRALPLVSFSIALKTGSLLDPEGLSGATRMLTRWMRRTAGGRDSHLIDAEIDALGGAFGADVSPSTLTFQGTVITRSLDGLVRIATDVLARPGFAEAEL